MVRKMVSRIGEDLPPLREQKKEMNAKAAASAAVLLMGRGMKPRRIIPPFLIEFVTEIFAFCFDFFRTVSSIIVDKKRGPGGTAAWWEKEFRKRE